MKLTVLSKHFDVSDELRQHIERRARFALSRFGDRVNSVSIRLSDINGPRGGHDTECLVRVDGRGWRIHILDVDANPYTVVSRACARAGRTAARKLERSRDRSRISSRKGLWTDEPATATTTEADMDDSMVEASALS